jgi:CO/xanthine dehydrogenase Mo-binding subunit
MSIIGQSIPRFDAYEKVTGKAQFPADINLPNQTYMKILFANRPHAIVHRIDIQQAKAYPGVIDILTAPDVPVNEYGLGIYDQPVLCGPGSPKPFTDRVRFIGDQVAVVIAESEEAAEAARELIQVDYEDLPIVTDPDEAMKDNSILLHPDRESNVLTHLRIRKGDIEQGFSQADVIVESEYITPMQEHAYLQPEAGIAYIDENEVVTVIASGQWLTRDSSKSLMP